MFLISCESDKSKLNQGPIKEQQVKVQNSTEQQIAITVFFGLFAHDSFLDQSQFIQSKDLTHFCSLQGQQKYHESLSHQDIYMDGYSSINPLASYSNDLLHK